MSRNDIDIVAKPTVQDYEPFKVLWSSTGGSGSTVWARDGLAEHHFPLDENTGLPILPDGYFWRISEFLPGSFYLAIMEDAEPKVEKVRTLSTYITGKYKEKVTPAVYRTVKAGSVQVNDKVARVSSAYHILQFLPNDLSVGEEPVLRLVGDFHPTRQEGESV